MIGIYKIENLINNKVYIGQSKDIEKRFKNHITNAFKGDASTNKEYNKYLYRAFRKYGINNFKMEILEECSETELNDKEHYYILKYHSNDDYYGYNETCGYEYNQYGVSCEKHPNHKLTIDDVYYIRECYNNHLDKQDVYKKFQDKINFTGFHKIWTNATWKTVHQDVYTEENKQYYLFNRNSRSGSQNPKSKLTEEMVYDIRLRKKNGEQRNAVYQDYKYTGISEGSFKQVWFYQNWKNIVV